MEAVRFFDTADVIGDGRSEELLALIVEGLSNPEIAARLVLNPSAVKFHISNVLSKLGVVALAIQSGLVTPLELPKT